MTEQVVLQQAKDYVVENFMYMRRVKTVGDEESLLRTGVITSLGMMEIVTWVEDTFGLTVDPDEITEQNFDTLRGIARFILRKQNTQAA